MAQKQYINFKDPVESLPLAEKGVGLMRPGRYSGFDIGDIVGTTLTLSHSNKIIKVDENGDPITFGSYKTPKGVVIHEHGTVTLNVSPPPAMLNTAKGIIIAEHDYQEVAGGVDATYLTKIINGLVYPTLTDPTKQCIIGYIDIRLQQGGNTFTYTPARPPLPGDGEMAQYIETIPYATTLQAGVVRKAPINKTGNQSNPYNNDEGYVTPKQLGAAGTMYVVPLPPLTSPVNPGWVTVEVTDFLPKEYLMDNIKSWDITWEDIYSTHKFIVSLKSGFYPMSFQSGVGFSPAQIGYPQLRIDKANKKMWVIYWSQYNGTIENANLVITTHVEN